MAQESSNRKHDADMQHVIPKASTDLNSGDYVVMPRNNDPISRARLGAESRISPVGAAYDSQWGIGIVDSDFKSAIVGATLYATPTANQALPVYRNGIFRLAIVQTAGKTGDKVMFSSGASGAQLFKLNNFRGDVAIGEIYEDFTGATANDVQAVRLYEKNMVGRDIMHWYGNRVLQGCKIKKHSVNNQASTQVNAGATGEVNLFILKNKVNSVARVTDFTCGSINPGGASAVRFYWMAVKVSTTGGAADFTIETCTGPFSAFASWTNSGISAGMMIPITWTSNMIPVALLVGWSATQVSVNETRILNLGGPTLPNGTKVVDHETWYL